MHSADVVWISLIRKLLMYGDTCAPRGLSCKEVICNTEVVDMSRCIATMRPKLGYRFLAAEAWWILSGRNDVESISLYSKHISSFSDNGTHFDGAYGPRIVDQLRYVVDSLTADVETRQAVMTIWRTNPRQSKDIPCTIAVQWLIRPVQEDGETVYRLHCIDTMRSSDSWLGWPYDIFNFSMLSAYIAIELRRWASEHLSYVNSEKLMGLQLGTVKLTAGSQHIYINPKEQGVTNIPYSIDDVESALSGDRVGKAYSSLNLDEFYSGQELIEVLANRKDGNVADGKEWMREFYQ